jgi:hypothetical protein
MEPMRSWEEKGHSPQPRRQNGDPSGDEGDKDEGDK